MHVSARPMGIAGSSSVSIRRILVEASEVEPCMLPTMPSSALSGCAHPCWSGVCISAIVSLGGLSLRRSGRQVTVHHPGTSKNTKTCCSLCVPYVALDPIKLSAAIGPTGGIVATYRTSRPLLVEATRCTAPMTVVTDLGERVVQAGDWIISGEDNERYIVDDAFFQRTFRPLEWMRTTEGKQYGC